MGNVVNSKLLTWSILDDRPTTLVTASLRQHLKRYAISAFYSVERGKEIWIWKTLLKHDVMIPDVDFSRYTFTSERAALSHALEMVKVHKRSPVSVWVVVDSQDTEFY